MLRETFPLECLSVLILIQLLQTSRESHDLQCNPSACGRIPDIRYPFRLKGDPESCGDSSYELVCENNTASLYLYSQKYHVQAIDYQKFTIRLVDAELENDTCSFPHHSLFEYHFTNNYPYSVYGLNSPKTRYLHIISWPITFMSCPYPINSSFFLETAHCGNRIFDSNASYYVKVGNLDASDVRDMCSIDLIVMTSWPFKDVNNLSLSDIHSPLLYGFELSWFSVTISRCKKKNSCSLCGNYLEGTNRVCSYDYYPWTWYIDWSLVIAILICGMAIYLALRILIGITFVFGLLVLVVYKLRRRHLSIFNAIEDFLQNQNNLMPIRYSYSDIKKMTKGFKEKLGEGGYGSVYKGKLRSGRDVAVKILGKSKANGQDFINEVTTTGRIHHVNIVRLVGYCADMSKWALVYDFMPNGSLEKYLSCQQGGTHSLTWEKKHAITLGVARGIEYLHRGCDMRILHFDIKPHNILLDDNFTPKISDFGLAKSYPTGNSIVTITAARGTIGYVAPELINRGIGAVSYKADVYSFGMLLMQIIGLKRDLIQNTELSSQYFPDWIYDRFNKGKDLEIGDAEESGCEESKITRKMTIVALWCIQMNPVDRPSMSKVMEMLESEVETLQIPPQPCQLPLQVAPAEDQTWGTDSTGSIALLCNASSSVNLTVE